MVSSTNNGNTKIIHTEALNEWIRNLKSKKQFKRKVSKGRDLRAIAILQNTLLINQKILQQKQRIASEKWLKMKKMLEESSKCDKSSSSDEDRSYNIENLEREREKAKIKMIWKEDLSDINSFMNNLDNIKTTLVR